MWIFYYIFINFIKKIKLNNDNNKIVLNSETKILDKILEKNKIDQSFYFIDVVSKEILKIHNINIFILIKNICDY